MKKIFPLIFLFAFLFSAAQEHPNWVNYTSTRSVKKIIQDKNILWIATKGGLIKHDLITKNNQYFNRGNSSIPANDINDILLDQQQHIWVATNLGVARYDGNTWTSYLDPIEGFNAYVLTLNMHNQVVVAGNYSLRTLIDDEFVLTPGESLLYLYPTDIVTNPVDSSIWVTAYTYGQFNICQYRDTVVQCFDQSNSTLPMESPRLNTLVVDHHGTVWADGGYYKKADEAWQVYQSTDDQDLGFIQSLAVGPDHHIWFLSTLSENHGQLIELDETYQIIRRINLPDHINYHYYQQHLYISPSRDLYVSSAFDGLWRFKNDAWERVDIHADFEIGNNVEQIFHTKKNTWIKSNDQNQQDSEFKIRNNQNNEWSVFENSILPDSLKSISRTGIVSQKGNDTLQFFINDRAWYYAGNQWIDVNLPDVSPLLDEKRGLIHFDPDGRRWILDAWTAFVLYESPSGWIVFDPTEHGNSSGSSTGYFNHPVTGEFWVAGSSGISVYDGQQWRQIKPSEQIEHSNNNRISDIVVTSAGIVWAVQPHHLLRFEGGEMQIISEINGIDLRNKLHSIALDQEENIWLGMNGSLGYLHRGVWTIYDTRNSGVIGDAIRHLAVDDSGNIWMGGHHSGVGIFHPDELSASFFVNKTEEPNQENATTSFSIFPNPHAKGARLCVDLPASFSTNDTTSGVWYSALGQKLDEFTTSDRRTIFPGSYFSKWPAGVYYLKLENNGTQYSQAVLLNQ